MTLPVMSIDDALNHRHISVASSFSADADTLVLCFAGAAGSDGWPRFEFVNMLTSRPINTLFIRDIQFSWYMRGLASISPTMDGVAQFFQDYANDLQPRRLVCIGHSTGGFAAIAYGLLLNADEIYAFSPQTWIKPLPRSFQGDFRWMHFFKRAIQRRDWRWLFTSSSLFWLPQGSYNDLRHLLEMNTSTQVTIHYGQRNRIDRLHAERLAKFPNIRLHPYDFADHQLVVHLKATDKLDTLLDHLLELSIR